LETVGLVREHRPGSATVGAEPVETGKSLVCVAFVAFRVGVGVVFRSLRPRTPAWGV
jgi:hypothetical protein